MKTAVVILAGGSGTRLWPLSRKNYPKQLIKITEDKSLITNSFERLIALYEPENIFISTNIKYKEAIKRELPEIINGNYIIEPEKRDRTAALALITLKLKDKEYDSVILVNCDEHISNIGEFLRVLKVSERVSRQYPDNLLIVGMKPTYPSKSFGYIEVGDLLCKIGRDYIFNINSFKEKPDKENANYFFQSGKYLWNSAWYVFNPNYMENVFKKHAPEILRNIESIYKLDCSSDEYKNGYSRCNAISFESNILESLNDCIVLPANVGWIDLGTWKAMHSFLSDENNKNNSFYGNIVSRNTEGSFVFSKNKNKLVTVIGMKDVIVVDTDDVLLVSNKENSKDLKEIIDDVPEDFK